MTSPIDVQAAELARCVTARVKADLRVPPRLPDLFDIALFEAMVDGGYVRIQSHPTHGLFIANYAEKAQYEQVWNDVTLTCRGLIFDGADRVIARPYRKFFNYGDDTNTGPLDLSAPVVVTDKLDGSLGISYWTPDGPEIATRGSFTSDQAIHATGVLRTRYSNWCPEPRWTYLWEIVYPDNRIVVDYAGTDDLILHGVIDTATGQHIPTTDVDWPGPRATEFPYRTLADALAAEPRPNAEGMVVRYLDSGVMVKLKQQDYVALHRIITGLNARTVWEWLGDGKTVGDLCATLPDEFHSWVEDLASELRTGVAQILTTASKAHAAALRLLPDGFTRGDYARAVSGYHCKPYLFLLLDGNQSKAEALAWREVRPSGARSMVNHSEAVA